MPLLDLVAQFRICCNRDTFGLTFPVVNAKLFEGTTAHFPRPPKRFLRELRWQKSTASGAIVPHTGSNFDVVKSNTCYFVN